MKKYESYKDSGVGWIGKIPSHWSCVPFRRIAKVQCNLVRPSENLTMFQISPDSIEKNSGKIIKTRTVEEAKVDSDNHRFYKGQILYSKIRPLLNKVTIAPYDGLCSADMYPISTIENTEYVMYYMLSEAFLSSVKNIVADRVKMPKINQDELKNTDFVIPPFSEQQVIVDYLKDKTLKIEQYVSARERERELLDSLKQSEIANVVTKGLNPNVRMKDSGIPWIGMIPEHWEIRRWGNAFIENKDINTNLENTDAFQFNYGSLVRKKRTYKAEEDAETYSKYTVLKPKDIVINGLNLNYDFVSQRVAISAENGIITSAYISMHPRKNVNAQYFCFLFKTMDAKKLFHGMGTGIRLTLSFAELKKQYIPIPPIEEQQAIVDYIEAKLSKIDSCNF